MVDKPGMITLEQLAELRARPRRDRAPLSRLLFGALRAAATVRAGELVKAGAIGRVIRPSGSGRTSLPTMPRPDWFFQRARYGGILRDIASHQCDQFLFFTGCHQGRGRRLAVANRANPQTPELEDFGDVLLRADGAPATSASTGSRPRGWAVWGDGRLTMLGTDGYIELRKYVDIAGRPGADHLFLVDGKGTRHLDCTDVALPYGPRSSSPTSSTAPKPR